MTTRPWVHNRRLRDWESIDGEQLIQYDELLRWAMERYEEDDEEKDHWAEEEGRLLNLLNALNECPGSE